MIRLNWTSLKTIIISKSLKIQHEESDTSYQLLATDSLIVYSSSIAKTDPANADQIDFETNYKPTSNQKIDTIEVDSQGRQIQRVAAASKGWSYLADSMELETSRLGSLYSKDSLGVDCTYISIKFYDADNVELLTQENIDLYCVKTEMILKPSYDYELVSGRIHHIEAPASNIRTWVVGGILELGGAYVKEFVKGINLKFFAGNECITTDGRASKYMKKDVVGVPYQANQLKFIFKHDVGVKHHIMVVLEYFRA